jgi:hypothetical protein
MIATSASHGRAAAQPARVVADEPASGAVYILIALAVFFVVTLITSRDWDEDDYSIFDSAAPATT